jgi:ribosome-associated protein
MTERRSAEPLALARAALSAAADKKAEKLLLLDLRSLSSFADYFVICTGGSERQLRAIADGVDEALRKEFGIHPQSVSGITGGGWALMDFSSVIVHIFLPSQRDYYNLEALWQKAPVVLRMQ